MTAAVAPLTLYGAAASGSVAIEAALTLIGVPYEVIEGATWAEASARERVAAQNPMRQVPTLVLADGEVMTESHRARPSGRVSQGARPVADPGAE